MNLKSRRSKGERRKKGSAVAHQHHRSNTALGVGTFSRENEPEFNVPHIALLHTISEEDSAFLQYNSCVEFTFEGQGRSSSRKLRMLNQIFEKMADKISGGIREDTLIDLMPQGSCGKFGLNEKALEKPGCQHRYLSRGTFLAMYSNESASFIFSMAQNMRIKRGMKRGKTKSKRGDTLPLELEKSLSKEHRKSKKSLKDKEMKRKSSKKKKEKKSTSIRKRLSMVQEKGESSCEDANNESFHEHSCNVKGSYIEGKSAAADGQQPKNEGECVFLASVTSALRGLFRGGSAVVPLAVESESVTSSRAFYV